MVFVPQPFFLISHLLVYRLLFCEDIGHKLETIYKKMDDVFKAV